MGKDNTSYWSGRVVCYDNIRKQCYDETGNQSEPITMKQAREAFESNQLADFNLALRSLAQHGEWDTKKLDDWYRKSFQLS